MYVGSNLLCTLFSSGCNLFTQVTVASVSCIGLSFGFSAVFFCNPYNVFYNLQLATVLSATTYRNLIAYMQSMFCCRVQHFHHRTKQLAKQGV